MAAATEGPPCALASWFLLMPTWGIQVVPPPEGQVVVVGDTHGQYHDVCRM